MTKFSSEKVFQDSIIALMSTYGITGWKVELVYGRSMTFGKCSEAKKTLTFYPDAMKHLTTSEKRDVFLHEIAHALVGNVHQHNEVWRLAAASIGAVPRARSKKITDLSYYRYVGRCPQDERHVYPRQRFSQRLRGSRCAKCPDSPTLTWEKGDEVFYAPPTT